MNNSYGNDNRGIRKFLREVGVKPNVSNVERIQREVSRSQSQHENVARLHKEMERARGIPATVDGKGRDAKAVAEAAVRRRLQQRDGR